MSRDADERFRGSSATREVTVGTVAVGTVLVGTVVVGTVLVGRGSPVVIAGPCAVETREQTLSVAHAVRDAGAHRLRGGAYKPRMSPYDSQGLGTAGLEILAEGRAETGLPIVTEAQERG